MVTQRVRKVFGLYLAFGLSLGVHASEVPQRRDEGDAVIFGTLMELHSRLTDEQLARELAVDDVSVIRARIEALHMRLVTDFVNYLLSDVCDGPAFASMPERSLAKVARSVDREKKRQYRRYLRIAEAELPEKDVTLLKAWIHRSRLKVNYRWLAETDDPGSTLGSMCERARNLGG